MLIEEEAHEHVFDVSTQVFRAYQYPDGAEYIVEKPMTVIEVPCCLGLLHRVIDKQGLVHEIHPGWLAVCYPEEAN